MLAFDEAAHAYTWAGKPVPGVTSVLERLTSFEYVPPAALERARTLGRAVHIACELDDLGDLVEGSVAGPLRPYLAAYRKFRAAVSPTWEGIEEQVFHPIHEYAGTLDRRGTMYKAPGVLDIKTGIPLPVVRLQTAAYVEAWCATRTVPSTYYRRWALYLRADGSYLLREVKTGRDDFRVFLSALNLYRWEKANAE